MTVLARPPDVIERAPLTVMLASCADELGEIQRLWPWFEELVGLTGRRMYATADLRAGTYSTCTPIRADDDAVALGLQVGELPGGRFRRGRLLDGEALNPRPATGSTASPTSARCGWHRMAHLSARVRSGAEQGWRPHRTRRSAGHPAWPSTASRSRSA